MRLCGEERQRGCRRPAPGPFLAKMGDPDVGLERLLGEVARDGLLAREDPQLRVDRPALLGLAEPLVQPAAGVEPAARRRVDRARHVALEDDPAALALGDRIRHRDGGQEGAGVRMARRRVHLVRRPDLDDLAEVHHRDPVADVLDHRQVVGDEQVCQPEPLAQVGQQVEDLALDRHVERRDRLVADDELGLDRERPGDADALALTARELVRIAADVRRVEADDPEQVRDPVALRLARGEVVGLERFGDRRADGHPRIERAVRVLEDDLHPPPHPAQRVGLERSSGRHRRIARPRPTGRGAG